MAILLFALLAIVACVFVWNLVKLAAVLTWTGLMLVSWPLRAALRHYGKGLRDARIRP